MNFTISLTDTCLQNILLWIIIIGAAGTIVTGNIQVVISRFYTDRNGAPFTGMQMEFCFSLEQYRSLIARMDDKMKGSVRNTLKVDYLFMFFLYGMMIALAIYLPLALPDHITDTWQHVFHAMIWITVVVWIFDILENILTAKNLTAFKHVRAFFQLVCTLIKWLAGVVYLLWLLSFVVGVVSAAIF
jgi:hypothetical protein